MADAVFTLVLHAHLPWVLHHGIWPHGTDWLSEAVAECYLPLWRVFHARAARGKRLPVTLGLSPVLCEQLAHLGFHRAFTEYALLKIEAARNDRAGFVKKGDPELAALAEGWERFYRSSLEDFHGPHGPNLVARFRRLEEQGTIEIVTCAATHGYLPLLSSDRAALRQIQVARRAHHRHFGRDPRGIWLPECAYRPAGPWPSARIADAGGLKRESRYRRGLEELLAAEALGHFFVDHHLVSGGVPLGRYADRFRASRIGDATPSRPATVGTPYRPCRVGVTQVSCLARDPATTVQVWSGTHGYPGDGDYLEFHKKHFPGGHRYWSVTDPKADLGEKLGYRPAAATQRIPAHAEHFVQLLAETARGARSAGPGAPWVCAMFDAELFGHWWFEGPRFLDQVFDRLEREPGLEGRTAEGALERDPPRESRNLPEGSWGDGGDHRVWLNDATRALWDPVHAAEAECERLEQAAITRPSDPLTERLVAQAQRELLLLEASDWPFLITTGAASDYAAARVERHAADVQRLADWAWRRLRGEPLDAREERSLREVETRDDLFADLEAPRSAVRSPSPSARGRAVPPARAAGAPASPRGS